MPQQIGQVAMLTCPSCATTLYLDGARLRDAGQAGIVHDAPQLFRIGQTVRLGRVKFTARGQAQFSYGRGWWDEFWGTTAGGEARWVSVDEGDIVMQQPLDARPPVRRSSRVGTAFEFDGAEWRVTETGEGECIALRGSFGDRLLVGDRYAYVNAESGGRLLSGEFRGSEQSWFLGQWFDPFEIAIEADP
ncbi:DUF4178 domain-containing protein [Thetidibacter halocola]|uniref:DUF4178 domain-containing protein n=1 Tax=Thetidibacter halocola TaxID=2827239 RepID=UPI0031FE8F2E